MSTVTPVAASVSAVFLTCADEALTYAHRALQAALLVNAHRPGMVPGPLWGARPLAGHPGVVVVAPPAQFGFNVDTGAPILARRVGAAWLLVAGRPELGPAPSVTQRLHVLQALRVTRLRLGHP